MQRGWDSRFLAFCSREPAQKYSAPSSQIAGNGVTCGRPSRRTVDSQNISDPDSTPATSAQGGATAPGSLNPSFNSMIGSISGIIVLLCSARSFSVGRRRAGEEFIAIPGEFGWDGSTTPQNTWSKDSNATRPSPVPTQQTPGH